MRIFVASLATESNSFSPIPTNRASYEAAFYYPPGQHPDLPRHTTAPLYVARRRARQEGFELIEGSCFWAEPSGPTNQADYEEMRDEILAELGRAMPVDGVLLGLHGAMIAYGYDDAEGDILERVRAIVGPKVPIGVELDPHCHLTEKRVRLSDIIILYKEYPHTDFAERGEELVTLLLKTIRGEVRPVMSLYDCRMSDLFPTSREPGRSFSDKLRTFEGRDGVLSVSLGHGYPQGDVPEHGTRVLVVTDNAKRKGDALARELGEEVRAKRGTWAPPYVSLDEAIEEAYAAERGPYVVADPSDNAGGGAASDNTNVIRRLIERGVKDACVGPVWDPIAVQFCHAVGVGGSFPLRFGGKTAVTSGQPIDAEVTVIGLKRDGRQSFGISKVPFGDAAGIRIDGVEVSLIAHRAQALGLEIFTEVGIELATKKFIGVKSTNHFFAAYGPIAAKVLYADGGGPSPRDLRKYPFKKIGRPMWPHDDLPEGRLVV
ncbi:MAG: microcystin degradation protein MlrC-like protein [Microvirga sp.]|jgi:microcystin degradation protein MlrC|nr:microcystin degradation protein MlrC-like protein [Microvirga sp.]